MKIIESMPFAADLLSPTYAESFRREGVVAGPGEVTLDSEWALSLFDTSEITQVAADHLAQFVAQSVGGELSCCGAPKRIALDVDAALDSNPETHRIRVSPDGIEVTGAGPAGVLQGVFRLENLMRERGGPILPVCEETRKPLFKHRIHRSPLSPFYVDEFTGYSGDPFNAEWISPGMDYPGYREEDAGPEIFYHDNMLMRLAEHGFNGIWIRGSFRHFARNSAIPEFGANSDEILGKLNGVCKRAARYGIRVFLYLNEPLGMREDDEFFKLYPQCRGAASTYKPMVNLCTSTPEIKTYLRESARDIFTRVPDLAGFVMITASEYPSHCWCRTGVKPENPEERFGEVSDCPRCSRRTPQDTVGELVRLIRDGAQSVKPEAEIIAWNWSWAMWEPDPQEGVLAALPEDTIVMGDYERGEPAEACGIPYTNDEYNIKVVGPSQRFRGVADFMLSRNRPLYARIQIGTTHENPDIPYLPVPHKIGQKYVTLRETGVSGLMTCWNFGNMPSLATEVAGHFSFAPQPEQVEDGIREIAVRNFGPDAADDVVAAWDILAKAHDDFPGSIPVMYNGPISRGPAFWFVFDQVNKKFPNSWLLDKDVEGDQLNWCSPFTPEQVLMCYRSEVEKGREALPLFESALAKAKGEDLRRLRREAGVAKFHLLQTESAANVLDFLLTRNAFYASEDAAEKRALLDRMEEICRDELAVAPTSIPLMEADSRLGWHGEAYGYMISPDLVREKLARLQQIVDERIPQAREAL